MFIWCFSAVHSQSEQCVAFFSNKQVRIQRR